MRETVDRYLIQRYETELRKELTIQGLPAKKIDDAIAESSAHLQESMEMANAQSAAEAETVLTQFGSPEVLAKKLAAEEVHLASRKRFLWPMLVVPLWIFFKDNPLPSLTSMHHAFYNAGLYATIASMLLFVIGFRARKPLLGQFGLIAAVLIVLQVVWLSATSYPAAFGPPATRWSPPFFVATRQSDFDHELVILNQAKSKELELENQLMVGHNTFVGDKPRASIPASLTYKGQYLIPFAVVVAPQGIKPGEMSGMFSSSWSDTVKAWNGKTTTDGTMTPISSEPLWTVPRSLDNMRLAVHGSEADIAFAAAANQVSWLEGGIASLKWYRTQPLPVRMWAFVQMVARKDIEYCAVATMTTFTGWLAWLAWSFLSRALRRAKYAEDRFRTT